MGERFEVGGHKGVYMVVRVDRRIVEVDSRNFDNYPYLRTFNPHLVLANRINDHMLESGGVVLTAHKNGGPVEVFIDGVMLDTGKNEVSERSLGLTIKSFDPRAIRDLEQADVIAKKVVRDGRAVVFEMVS